MLKFALPQMRNPNASQWNIACVGSPGVGAHVGHIHFMSFVSFLCVLGSQHERSFQWNMGLTVKGPVSKATLSQDNKILIAKNLVS